MIRLLWPIIFLRRAAWRARRAHRSGWFVFFSATAALGEAAVVAMALLWLWFGLVSGELLLAGVVIAFVLLFMLPGRVAEAVAVPRGWYRVAWWLSMFERAGASSGAGPARLRAARALARAGLPPDGVAWLRDRPRHRLDADDVAVAAVLAQARGHRDDARRLFASLCLLIDPAPEARELAAEWLALDDAERGDWEAIAARGRARARPGRGAHREPDAIRAEVDGVAGGRGEPLWPATSTTYFLEGVAGRLLGRADAPSQLGLVVRWLEAPRRRRTRALLQRGLAAGARPIGPARTDAAAVADDGVEPAAPAAPATPIGVAVRCHAMAVATTRLDTVAAAARAWDVVLDDVAWRDAVLGRAAALGAAPDAGTRTLSELRDQVVDDLATAIVAGKIALPDPAPTDSAVLERAVARARRELLSHLELTFECVSARVREQAELSAIDEWRSFLAVHAAYQAAVDQGGLAIERLAFPHAHTELTSWTVWMWNDRHEHVIAHAMITWLFERALAVGDSEAIELHGRNAALLQTR